MATFYFKVQSDKFHVLVSRHRKKYIKLGSGSIAEVDLKKRKSLIFKFEGNPEKTYMKWDDQKQYLNKIDFKKIACYFALTCKDKKNKLLWKVKCMSNETNGLGDENVTVTFGEDQPEEVPRIK